MSMTKHAQATIHRADLLVCGCRVSPESGDVFARCARHACYGIVSFKELPEYALQNIPLPKHPDGLRALCPRCASLHIHPNADNIVCRDCGHVFMPAEVIGFALSVDSKPVQCEICNNVHYEPCSCQSKTGDRNEN